MELCSMSGLKGKVTIPGDKSISHRCVMFGSIANGTTEIHNFLSGADCLATIRCFSTLGIKIETDLSQSKVIVHGKGLHGLNAPSSILDVGNSGTTTRLISGILAGQPFNSELSGDESLNSRPMKRIIEPLTSMGATSPVCFRMAVHRCISLRHSSTESTMIPRLPVPRSNPVCFLPDSMLTEKLLSQSQVFPETIPN